MKFPVLMMSLILAAAVVHAAEPTPSIPAVLVISQCNLVVGVVFTDDKGGLHPVDIDGMTVQQVKDLASRAVSPMQATLPCSKPEAAI